MRSSLFCLLAAICICGCDPAPAPVTQMQPPAKKVEPPKPATPEQLKEADTILKKLKPGVHLTMKEMDKVESFKDGDASLRKKYGEILSKSYELNIFDRNYVRGITRQMATNDKENQAMWQDMLSHMDPPKK